MAIASPSSSPTFSASFPCNRAALSTRLTRFSNLPFSYSPSRLQSLTVTRSPTRRAFISSGLNASTPSGAGGSVSPENGDLQYQLHHMFCPHRRGPESPVFVALPIDTVGPTAAQVRRSKTLYHSLKALAATGVEGVVMEVWWGLVEREQPGVYNWKGYLEIVAMARLCGLKVRAVMAFHQCGTGSGDQHWIPLPEWVLEEFDKNPDLAYSDRFGRRNMEYISLGCDILPVLRGRSPIQAYADFMRNFRNAFRPFFGDVITGIQVGMGPTGELRYPRCPPQKLMQASLSHELGEFHCYDKYMLASLNACAQDIGMLEWGYDGPVGASSLMQDPEHTGFFRSDDGSWNSPYGKFFLEWYSRMLLLHGERICREAESIFRGLEVNLSAKVAAIHWHYGTQSHPSELTAGYYNTSIRDGYLPIARMFGRYKFSLCCRSFEMQDVEEKQMNPVSSPEGFLRQLLSAARACDVPLEAENRTSNWDDGSFDQVLKMSKYYSAGLERPSFSFNFVRMDKNMFDPRNWVRFTHFVRQMSVTNIFRARLGSLDTHFPKADATKVGFTFAYR